MFPFIALITNPLVAIGIGAAVVATKLLHQEDDSPSACDDTRARRQAEAQRQAQVEAAAKLEEAKRRMAQQEEMQRRESERHSIDLALRSLCQRFSLPPCSLSELQRARQSCEQQFLGQLEQQNEQTQLPLKTCIDTLSRALEALEKLA